MIANKTTIYDRTMQKVNIYRVEHNVNPIDVSSKNNNKEEKYSIKTRTIEIPWLSNSVPN